MDKFWYIHLMDYYTVFNKARATYIMWINLKDIEHKKL